MLFMDFYIDLRCLGYEGGGIGEGGGGVRDIEAAGGKIGVEFGGTGRG